MAAIGTNGVVELLEILLRILKEEGALDASGDHPVAQFVHPEELKVNSDLVSSISTCDAILRCANSLTLSSSLLLIGLSLFSSWFNFIQINFAS